MTTIADNHESMPQGPFALTGPVPKVDPRFFGLAVSATAPEGELAQLTATPVAGSPDELRLLLQAADGSVIVGPFVARPVVVPAVAEHPCR